MSDLEDLAEIAEQHAFGFGHLSNYAAAHPRPAPPARETCGNGHPWNTKNTRHYRDTRGRIRRICRVCDRERRAQRACARNAPRMPAAEEIR